jgi:hypothetical protein
MIKLVEALAIIIVIIFAFFMGVKYSNQVKNQARWIFDSKPGEEVEIPDLSNQNDNNINQNVDDGGNDINDQPNIEDTKIEPTQDNDQDKEKINPDDIEETNSDMLDKK